VCERLYLPHKFYTEIQRNIKISNSSTGYQIGNPKKAINSWYLNIIQNIDYRFTVYMNAKEKSIRCKMQPKKIINNIQNTRFKKVGTSMYISKSMKYNMYYIPRVPKTSTFVFFE